MQARDEKTYNGLYKVLWLRSLLRGGERPVTFIRVAGLFFFKTNLFKLRL